jgi:hypothetical protein
MRLKGKTNVLDDESIVIEDIVVHHNATSVPDCFANAAQTERNLLTVSPIQVGVAIAGLTI